MANNDKKMGFEPEIVVLYCQHCVCSDAEVTLESEKLSSPTVKAVMMPCSSKVQVPHLMKILADGADGVELVACSEKACRFMVGSCRAEKRIKYARNLLDSIGVGAERLGISRKSQLSAAELMALAISRADAVTSLGPGPMKKGDSK